jgi:Tfp pilus assembly protein PilF
MAESIDELMRQLLYSPDAESAQRIILTLVELARTDMNHISMVAVQMIGEHQFDGSKWSSLALTLLDRFRNSEEPGRILEALVSLDQDNGAYLNNFGVFLQYRGRIGEAIEYYARAYATDYKAHGHETALTFPAWMNLHLITSSLR